MTLWPVLQAEAAALADRVPALAAGLGETALAPDAARGLAGLLRRMVPGGWLDLGALAERVFAEAPDDVAAALADLETITRLNFEPGGLVGTWLGGRGFHMLVAHRLAHRLWQDGETELAIAAKTGAAILGADIHPAAKLGRGLFLDHGIGLVVGETAVIEDGVCLWHGVTLGSTLMADGDRHPKIRRGAVLGAAATILGNIEVGEASVVASGSVVLRSVPPHTTVAGNPAAARGQHRHPYPQHLAALEIAA
ncbi:serine O-acetyltransferase [Teichococcus deserti]|nr:serine O-acetyltransferase [Pseudoroseomonas deserti]